MQSENMYIPQQDEIEVTILEAETIDYSDYPLPFDLDFEIDQCLIRSGYHDNMTQ